MHQAADTVQVLGRGAPGFFCVPRCASEAAVVGGKKAAQGLVGRVQIGGAGQTEFACETILEGAPEAFDAALGLRTVRGDVGDAELFEGAAELSGLPFAGELFFDRPVVVVADEDTVAITIEAERNAVAAQQAAEQTEIAAGVFGGEELGAKDFAGGVVEESEQGELGTAIFQPAVEAGVEQKHFAFTSASQTALAMSRGASFAGRPIPAPREKAAEGLATEGKAFDLRKLFAEMVIVETGVARAGQLKDAGARGLGQAARTGTAAADVCQSRFAALPVAGFEAFDVPRRKVEQRRGSGTRQVPPIAG